MSTFARTDRALVAPLTICEVSRSTIEKAKRIFETQTSTKDERKFATGELEDIFNSDPATRTTYHYCCAGTLLAMYSTEELKERKIYANKCLAEARKKLRKIDSDEESFPGEYDLSIQLFTGLQAMAIRALDAIGAENRKALLASGGVQCKAKVVKPAEARHAKKKKKKVSWGGIATIYDDGEEEVGGMYDDYNDPGNDDDSDEDYEYYKDEAFNRDGGFPEIHDDIRATDTKWV